MKRRLRSLWDTLRSSLWFLPTLIVIIAVGMALLLVEVDAGLGRSEMEKRWPLLFGAGTDGARSMLSAIAGSMITVAGVVFSITVVALALASSQYTSRILRSFMRDRASQCVLGVFVGVYAYCLVVLRTIRGREEEAFVPLLAVFFAVILAFVAIGFLIFFVHHISSSIQATSVVEAAARETIATLDRLFPDEEDGVADPGVDSAIEMLEHPRADHPIPAPRTGYIQALDCEALMRFACRREVLVRMVRGVGEFVVEGAPLVTVSGHGPPDQKTVLELRAFYTVGGRRTMVQDIGFGVRQLVDVALRALSSGLNDTTTAVHCVDYLAAILARLASRRIPLLYRMDQGELRIIARGATFQSLLSEAFDQIRQNATDNVVILVSLVHALEVIAGFTQDAERRRAIRRQSELIVDVASRSRAACVDDQTFVAAVARLDRALR